MLPNIPITMQTEAVTTTYIINHDDRSEVTKCLERSGMEDLNAKNLKGEDFTDEDVARITTCIKDRKEERARILAVIISAVILVFFLGIVWAILS